MTLHCLVADDHPAIVSFLRQYLEEQGIEVTATAADGEEALAKIERQHPEVALVDVRMPKLDGVEIARRAAKTSPQTAVIAYTGYGDEAILNDALDAGIRGFVQKDSPLPDLKRAIEAVAAGNVYIDPGLAWQLTGRATPDRRPLTERERDVLRLLAAGRSNEEAGAQLFISPETVRTHVRKAMRKLGADTRTEAVATALREKLIS